MASKLHYSGHKTSGAGNAGKERLFGTQQMRKDFLIRFSAIPLALLTLASIVFAVINFQKESQYPLSDDGVWWLERNGSIQAERLTPGGPAEKAGFQVGDKLLAVNGQPVRTVAEQNRRLASAGFAPYTQPTYSLDRRGVKIDAPVILDKADTSLHFPLRLIALVYLGIGFYVLFRRWTAPKSTHFYLFCLVSFVFYSFHYIGKWNTFDTIIYWSNEVAWLLQPAIFLHFALIFPEARKPLVKRPWLVFLAYLPGAVLLAIQVFAMTQWQASTLLVWNLDRIHTAYQAVYFIAAATVLWQSFRRCNTPISGLPVGPS